MRLGAKPFELLLDVGSLTPDAFEPSLVFLHLLLVGALLCDNRCGNQQEQQGLHTRLRWRPTLSELPSKPIKAPKATIAAACSCVKNADCNR